MSTQEVLQESFDCKVLLDEALKNLEKATKALKDAETIASNGGSHYRILQVLKSGVSHG